MYSKNWKHSLSLLLHVLMHMMDCCSCLEVMTKHSYNKEVYLLVILLTTNIFNVFYVDDYFYLSASCAALQKALKYDCFIALKIDRKVCTATCSCSIGLLGSLCLNCVQPVSLDLIFIRNFYENYHTCCYSLNNHKNSSIP